MSNWSLEQELCGLAETTVFRKALYKLGLTAHIDEQFTVIEDKRWIQGGAETYIYQFWICRENGSQSGYVVKICIAFAPASSPQDTLKKWISRRKLISAEGVSTPLLVTYGNGVLIEEHIPYRLKDLLIAANPSNEMLKDLALWAGVVTRLGFYPIDAFYDLRSRGNDVVITDFGQDLGPAGVRKNQGYKFYHEMLNMLRQLGRVPEKEVLDELKTTYNISSRDDNRCLK